MADFSIASDSELGTLRSKLLKLPIAPDKSSSSISQAYTVRIIILFYQLLDKNYEDSGIWRYTSSKTWILSDNFSTELAPGFVQFDS